MLAIAAAPDEPLQKNETSGGARFYQSCLAGTKITLLISKKWIHFS